MMVGPTCDDAAIIDVSHPAEELGSPRVTGVFGRRVVAVNQVCQLAWLRMPWRCHIREGMLVVDTHPSILVTRFTIALGEAY